MAIKNFNMANKDLRLKKLAKKKAQARARIKCKGNASPSFSVSAGGSVKAVCRAKDVQKSLKTKQMLRKIKFTRKFLKSRKKAAQTRIWRANH